MPRAAEMLAAIHEINNVTVRLLLPSDFRLRTAVHIAMLVGKHKH